MSQHLVRLRERNQITLPAEIVRRLAIEPGALLELELSPDGDHVELRHAEVVRAGTPRAERELEQARNDMKEGRFATFANTQELANDLEKTRQQIDLDSGSLLYRNFEQEFEDLRKRLGLIEVYFGKIGAGGLAVSSESKLSSKG